MMSEREREGYLADISKLAKNIAENKRKARIILAQDENISKLALDLKELHTINGR